MPGGRKDILDDRDFDAISAIWMMACSDQDAIITYRGIEDRLQMTDVGVDDASVRKLVRGRGELFSTTITRAWLDEWKAWVIGPPTHYPRWVVEKVRLDATLKGEDLIKSLDVTDVFRCQLRHRRSAIAGDPPGDPPCTPDQVKLGLEHIDRLRKAAFETRDERLKRRAIVVPAIVAICTVLASSAIAWTSMQTTAESARQATEAARREARQTAAIQAWDGILRSWDLARQIRGDAYESTFEAMQLAFDAARRRDKAEMQRQLARANMNLYKLEPLIDDKGQRQKLWADYHSLDLLCSQVLGSVNPMSFHARNDSRGIDQRSPVFVPISEDLQHEFVALRTGMHELLQQALFSKSSTDSAIVLGLEKLESQLFDEVAQYK